MQKAIRPFPVLKPGLCTRPWAFPLPDPKEEGEEGSPRERSIIVIVKLDSFRSYRQTAEQRKGRERERQLQRRKREAKAKAGGQTPVDSAQKERKLKQGTLAEGNNSHSSCIAKEEEACSVLHHQYSSSKSLSPRAQQAWKTAVTLEKTTGI